jgi:ATP-dependent DNA helicase RecG
MIPKAEGIYSEFKTSFSDEVIISLVAFCNAKGGTVYIGLNDNGEAKGVLLGKETIAYWLNEIKNKTLPAIIPNVDVLPYIGKSVVAFSVAEYPVKPVAMKGRYYQRRANSNHLLSAVEIADLSLQSRQLSWDSYPYPDASFNDLNVEKINRFISKVNDVGRFALDTVPKIALEKLGMLQKGIPTNAAMILFSSKDLHYNVHIGRFKTPSLIIADKMLSGNLFDVLEEAMQTIIGHLKFAFEITGKSTERTEIPEYPLEAVRELLLNALVHRDYQSSTDVQIKIFDNSISFFNPTGLYGNITEDDLKTDTYRASTRNKQIAEVFYLTKEIEKYGSGFSRIRREISTYPTMVFNYRNTGYGFFAEFAYSKQKISLTEKTTEKTTEKIYQLIKINPYITINELATQCGLSIDGVFWNIKKLKKTGRINREGGRKLGYWQVNDHN